MLIRLKDYNTIGAVMDFMSSNDLNYEVVKEDSVPPQNIIKIKEDSVMQTCGGCPTIYEFEDIDGNEYYFRLRHGYWSFCDETNSKTIASGNASSIDADGVCGWDEAKELILEENYKIVEKE